MTLGRPQIVVIPGIGGHPEFHADLIQQLEYLPSFAVVSFPHGDFSSGTFTTMRQHVTHWAALIDQVATKAGGPINLIGISFGAGVAQCLPTHTLRHVRSICLVSPVLGGPLIRTGTRIARLVDSRFMANAFGRAIFRWSEITMSDRSRLKAIREAHYDDVRQVRLRLWRRFLCLDELPATEEFLAKAQTIPLSIIYGRNEFLLMASQVGGCLKNNESKLCLRFIADDHAASLNNSGALHLTIREHLGAAYECNI